MTGFNPRPLGSAPSFVTRLFGSCCHTFLSMNRAVPARIGCDAPDETRFTV
jgi:hypothetical protein